MINKVIYVKTAEIRINDMQRKNVVEQWLSSADQIINIELLDSEISTFPSALTFTLKVPISIKQSRLNLSIKSQLHLKTTKNHTRLEVRSSLLKPLFIALMAGLIIALPIILQTSWRLSFTIAFGASLFMLLYLNFLVRTASRNFLNLLLVK